MSVLGIDVGKSQPDVDWHQVAKHPGMAFAITQASFGSGAVEPDFVQHWQRIREAGLIRGAYHYAYPQYSKAAVEAEGFLKVVHDAGGFRKGDLPPILDLEEGQELGSAGLYAWVQEWVRVVHLQTGRAPIIYTGSVWKEYLQGYKNVWGCPLWISHYEVRTPVLPTSWKTWTLWQWTSHGSVPGVSGNVDLNYFNGSLAELRAFAGGRSAPGPAPGPHGWEGKTLKLGSRGEDVREWQERMRERGFTLRADGVFDEESARSCRWLQLYLRYPPTSEVDKAVWEATFTAP